MSTREQRLRKVGRITLILGERIGAVVLGIGMLSALTSPPQNPVFAGLLMGGVSVAAVFIATAIRWIITGKGLVDE